jgi:hypothetical protein
MVHEINIIIQLSKSLVLYRASVESGILVEELLVIAHHFILE